MSGEEEYLALEEYGIIGNMVTAALVSRPAASIDFMCYPYFDSPAVFCRILDAERGGFVQVSPIFCGEGACPQVKVKQLYRPSSNVLITRYSLDGGIAEVTDFFPCHALADGSVGNYVVRKVEAIRGSVDFGMSCKPTFNYALDRSECNVSQDNSMFVFSSEAASMSLRIIETTGSNPVTAAISSDSFGSAMVEAKFRATKGHALYLVFGASDTISILDAAACELMLTQTDDFWYRWISKCTYKGRWREMVNRSALTMKLLTFQQTGAIIASPTFGLPEKVGGGLNWDYRYVWIRDAAFSIYGFLRIGLLEEADAFMRWIEARLAEMMRDPELRPLKIMYDIRGTSDHRDGMCEVELDHLSGYKNSRPVRIGNKASEQTQLDIYGELMDAIYLCDKYVRSVSYDFWCYIRELLIKPVLQTWNTKDSGIWELRGPTQHYTYSKVMCWVALDRGIRLVQKHSLPGDVSLWTRVRDEIKEDIMAKGWSPQLQAFVQHYESEHLDASNLIMGLVFFSSPTDPRFLSTLRRTMAKPEEGGLSVNGLVFRFNNPLNRITTYINEDGRKQTAVVVEEEQHEEETFTMCSFWMIEAMARAGHADPALLRQAVRMFENVSGYANHVGLFSEEISLSGQQVGNFPQAFTHLSYISAAFNIDRALDDK